MMQGTQQFFAERFYRHRSPDIDHPRSVVWSTQRHRLDLFTSADVRRNSPVLVFVHGGGFVMGDKRTQGLPFYDNVGDFAVRSGFFGRHHDVSFGTGSPVARRLRRCGCRGDLVAHPRGGLRRRSNANFSDRPIRGSRSCRGLCCSFTLPSGGGAKNIAGALMISGVYDIAQADAKDSSSARITARSGTSGRLLDTRVSSGAMS